MTVYYECDGKQCRYCGGNCHQTSDVSHAKNFVRISDDFYMEGMEYPVTQKSEITGDNVNHPAHYQGKHECIDEMIALFGVEAVKHFCMCNVYKYRFRAANKNGQEDLDKADWYMDKLLELCGEVIHE